VIWSIFKKKEPLFEVGAYDRYKECVDCKSKRYSITSSICETCGSENCTYVVGRFHYEVINHGMMGERRPVKFEYRSEIK